MPSIIVSYINPDLDGVACSLALARLKGTSWEARLFGKIDAETDLVLRHLGLTAPVCLTKWDGVVEIWLVDTHHPAQLPSDFPAKRVIHITDHHPGGSPGAYPGAEVQNESVGAAATLVAERYFQQHGAVPVDIAVLLQCAILSNTLDFAAPATSPRDHGAFQKLAVVRAIEPILLEQLQNVRRAKLSISTDDLIAADVKLFETPRGSILVSQVEAPGAIALASRSDLLSALQALSAARSAASGVLNLVDTEAGKSLVLATDHTVLGILADNLAVSNPSEMRFEVSRILQRKTDIIPYIIK